jgi:eukaryotic-like serine/threonine-protein kinase
VGSLFTAPELVADPRLLDRRSDIYSMGAVWFNILTGRPPAGSSLGAQLDAVAEVSLDYKAVVMRCLADISATRTRQSL